MTEMQPTEIELTGKKRKHLSLSKRKIAFFVFMLILVAAIIALVVTLAHQASLTPEIINQTSLPSDRPEPK